MENTQKIKAYAYLRVSGKGQVEGDGFTRQAAAVTKYCEASNIKILKTFQDKGQSGTVECMERPAFVEMVAEMMRNDVTTILIEKLDRLGRDLMVQEHIIVDLKNRGITLISAYEPDLCVDDPTRRLLRQIMGAIAEYDKTMTVLKLRGARQRKKKESGRCEGRKPYGTNPNEVAPLANMKAWREEGCSLESIARRLDQDGIPPRHGKRWHATSVSRIIER